MDTHGTGQRLFLIVIGVIFFLAFLPCLGHAIPPTINYQGYLTDSHGVPVHGTVSMHFSIYNVSTGGAALWTETQSVAVTNGVYSVNLGQVTPINLAFDVQYYLGVAVGADPAMLPRQALTSVGYAFRAETAEVDKDTLGGLSCSSGQVAKWNGSAWLCAADDIGTPVTPSSTVANLDGVSSAGSSALYSRGDHKHGIAVGSITSSHIQDGTISDVDISASAAISFSKLSGVASATHNHDAAYVNVTGDTMTGALNLPANGLVAGTNQLALSGGNVGIGTTSPTQKLEVSGNVRIGGTGNGLAFPDGTTQTTAVTGGGGGVPSGFMILGDTSTAPAGYTYTGMAIGMPGSWATKANMPTARHQLTAATVNNRVYAIGGSTTSGSWGSGVAINEEYDPATNTWATKAPMPTPRWGVRAGVVNNKVYAIGGTINGSTAVANNEEYDPATNTWTSKTNMPTARVVFGAAAVNNKIYAIGGTASASNIPLSTNEEYDPATNTWATNKAPMPTARFAPGAAVVNNRIYIICGSNGSVSSTNEAYDPATDTWVRKASVPTARSDIGTAAVNDKIYAIGGFNGTTAFPTNEEYDAATDNWTTRVIMPTARAALAVAVVNNKVYAIGGTGSILVIPLTTNEEFTPELLYVHKKN